LWIWEKEEIGAYFPEFFKQKQIASLNNGLHLEEPNCGHFKNALNCDEIAWITVPRSYVQWLAEKKKIT